MKIFKVLFCFLFLGCTINSISPSGGGLEMDMDLSLSQMRHGWAYFSRPQSTDVYVRDESAIARGKDLFMQHCQKCHGETAKGDGPLAQALKLKPTDLTNLSKNKDSAYLIIQISDGKGSMPQWKDFLTKKQEVDLTQYIQDLNNSKIKKKK